jgi:hypothetical protein
MNMQMARFALTSLLISVATLVGCKEDHSGAHPEPGAALDALLRVDPEVVVARIDGHPIGLDEVIAYWSEHRELSAQEALEAVVARHRMVQFGLEKDETIGLGEAELTFARKQAMVRVLLERLVEAEVTQDTLTPEEISEMEQSLGQRAFVPPGVRASHILVQVPRETQGQDGGRAQRLSEEQRERLYQESRPIIDAIAAELAREQSVNVDSLLALERTYRAGVSAPLGLLVNAHLSFPIQPPRPGESLPAGWIRVVPAFMEAAAELANTGAVPALSPPVRSEFGWHVILLEETFDARAAEPNGLRELAMQEALRLRRAGRLEELLTQWVEQSTVYLYPDVIARQGQLYRQ